ncbi:putative reverse transcriptase domain-containing protein [Tanacetum coccineum]
MALTMTTRNAGRRTSATRGGRTGGQTGRGGGRTGKQTNRVGGQTGDQGSRGGGEGANKGVDEVPDFSTVIAQQLQGLLPTIVAQIGNDRNGCSYKDFVACKPKEFDDKGGTVAYIRWVEKMEAVQDISSCGDNQKVEYSVGALTGGALRWWNSEVKTRGREAAVGMTWENFKTLMKGEYYPSNVMKRLEIEFWSHSMVGVGHSAYTDRFHELARLVPYLVTPETKRIERMLTDEAVRNESLKRTGEKRGDGGESSKEGNVKGDNKRARTGKVFAIITNPVRKEAGPKMVNPLNARNPTKARGSCYECGGTDHYKETCPRLNRAPRHGGNRLNQALAIEGVRGRGNNGNLARGRAFMIGVKEALQDPNIVMGTLSLNNHYAMMLFDSGADYSFVSTTFLPLLDIKASSLGFSYEIEIARGHESFDVIIGMDWLSRHRAEIVCHERVVRIPLLHGDMLRVYGERSEEKVKHLMSAKAEEPKLEDITIVQNFSEVFSDDLSGLPPSREVEFYIDIIPGEMPVAKSPYRLAPTEIEELSNQLREL